MKLNRNLMIYTLTGFITLGMEPVLAQGTYPAQNPSVTPSAQSASPSATGSAATGTGLCGTTPTCTISANTTQDFFKYLGNCNKLGGATIKWQATPYITISIKPDPQNYCAMQATNTFSPNNPTTATCYFSSAQITQMVTPDNITLIDSYEKATTRADKDSLLPQLNQITKPIFDCIGPTPEVVKQIPAQNNQSMPAVPPALPPAAPATQLQ